MSKILHKEAANRKRRLNESNEIESIQAISKKIKQPENSKRTTKADIKSPKPSNNSDVIYVGHIPHGFYEREMRAFFSQFGVVRNVKLFRSEKTGNSKGYAFVKFESNEVAEVVADAINGYLLFDKQLVCNVLPLEKIHKGLFLRSKSKQTAISEEEVMLLTDDQVVKGEKNARNFLRAQQRKIDKLKRLGIDVDFPLHKNSQEIANRSI